MKRSHVILIHTDQQRYDSLGCTGNAFARTPHIDRLAEEGTQFHRHIAANPVCMPSRASLFTGRYPNASGVYMNGVALPRTEHVTKHPMNEGNHLSSNGISHVQTMPDVFKAAGYRTCSIGKLHLTCTNAPRSAHYEESRVRWNEELMDDWHGPYYGFDHVDLTIGHGEDVSGHYREWLRREYPEVMDKLNTGEHRVADHYGGWLYPSVIPEEAHHSTWIGDRAVSYLQEHAASHTEEPIFMFVGFPDPHFPFTPPASIAKQAETCEVMPAHRHPDEQDSKPVAMRSLMSGDGIQRVDRYEESFVERARQYTDGMISLIDKNVGRICDTLRELGIYEDTIIVFTSDHGDYLGDHGLIFKSNLCSNALNHVPFILKATALADVNETRITMSNTDVLPTLCELAGVSIPSSVQGSSVLAALKDKTERTVKVICYDDNPDHTNISIYDNRYRLTWFPVTDEYELYDHAEDPYELHNLAGSSDTGTQHKLKQLYLQLMVQHCKHDRPLAGRISNW